MMPLNLNRREKYYVAIAGAVIAILLFSQLVISPINKKRDSLSRALVVDRQQLQEMRSLQSELKQLKEKATVAQSKNSTRAKNFNLSNFLNKLAGEQSIATKIDKMGGVETETIGGVEVSTLELKLKGITTEQLSKFLYSVECSGNNLFVEALEITQTSKPADYIDVRLEVKTFAS